MNCEFAHDGMTGNADMDGIVGRDWVRIVAARRTAASRDLNVSFLDG